MAYYNVMGTELAESHKRWAQEEPWLRCVYQTLKLLLLHVEVLLLTCEHPNALQVCTSWGRKNFSEARSYSLKYFIRGKKIFISSFPKCERTHGMCKYGISCSLSDHF